MRKKSKKLSKRKIAQLYDRLVRLFLGFTEVPQGVIRYYTPKSVSQIVDLSSLEPVSSAHISGRFGTSYSDVIYQARLKNGDSARLLFLFEHKSTRPDYPVHLQLLDYIKQLWEDDLRHGRPPSLIISIVLYHGERPWVHKTLIEELFGKPPRSLQPYLPNFRYIAINLNEMSVEDILKKTPPGYLQNLFILLKFARNLNQLGQHLPSIWAVFKKRLFDIRARMLGQSTVNYIENLLDMNDISVSEWMKQLPSFAREAYEEMLAEYRQRVLPEEMEKAEIRGIEKGRKMGREEGREEGREQGREQGREEMKKVFIINLLTENPDWSDARIAALADTTEEQVALMRQQLASRKGDPPSDN